MAVSELNEKQKRFCEEYLVDLNATKAYIRAGYSEKGASVSAFKLLGNTNISEYLVELRNNQKEKTGVTTEYILEGLKEIAQRSMQRVPVMVFDKEAKAMVQEVDEETGEGIWKFDANAANKSFELLGKHIGFFEVDNSQKKPDVPAVAIYLPDNNRDATELQK